MVDSPGARAIEMARWEAERTAERRRPVGWVVCPACREELPIRNPSVPARYGNRLGAAYCSGCRKAWRAQFVAEDGVWRVIWDVGAGERVYVLNGKMTNGE